MWAEKRIFYTAMNAHTNPRISGELAKWALWPWEQGHRALYLHISILYDVKLKIILILKWMLSTCKKSEPRCFPCEWREYTVIPTLPQTLETPLSFFISPKLPNEFYTFFISCLWKPVLLFKHCLDLCSEEIYLWEQDFQARSLLVTSFWLLNFNCLPVGHKTCSIQTTLCAAWKNTSVEYFLFMPSFASRLS